MTLTLQWWLIPILLVAIGLSLAWKYGRPKGRYDYVSPLIGGIFAAAGIGAAVGLVIGRLVLF